VSEAPAEGPQRIGTQKPPHLVSILYKTSQYSALLCLTFLPLNLIEAGVFRDSSSQCPSSAPASLLALKIQSREHSA